MLHYLPDTSSNKVPSSDFESDISVEIDMLVSEIKLTLMPCIPSRNCGELAVGNEQAS